MGRSEEKVSLTLDSQQPVPVLVPVQGAAPTLRIIPEPYYRNDTPVIEIQQFSDIQILCVLSSNSSYIPSSSSSSSSASSSSSSSTVSLSKGWSVEWLTREPPPSNQRVSQQSDSFKEFSGVQQVSRNLTVYSVRAANGGNYTCRATSFNDTISKSFILVIKPQQLSNVTGIY